MSDTDQYIQPVVWHENRLRLLDQRLLPEQTVYLDYTECPPVAGAIQDMVVRGAPAIGITAAYAVVLSALTHNGKAAAHEMILDDMALLQRSRPTAVNLAWALARMKALLDEPAPVSVDSLLTEANRIHEEERQANLRMAEFGTALLSDNAGVLTHCNTGSLATAGSGTALGVIRHAYRQQKIRRIYATETRPWLQGSRLTAWELAQHSIPVAMLCDSAAAQLMQHGQVSHVIVGADRIAANGDVANKIGTYALAVAAQRHAVKFIVVAPVSTLDPKTPQGSDIPVEQRDSGEILSQEFGEGVTAWNPVFDITPAGLITAIVTERGVIQAPDSRKIAEML